MNGMFRSLVLALVGIFTPVFLYKMDGIPLVAGYFILMRVTTLFFSVPISWIIERIGFRRSIAFSMLFMMINLGSLLLAQQYGYLIFVAAIAAGLNTPLYWVARGSAIAQEDSKSKIGSQMAWMGTAERMAALLGPITAGLIVEFYGFRSLYSLALIIAFLSLVPLWGMSPHNHKNSASWKGFYGWLKNRRYFHVGIGVGAKAIDDYAITVLWPLAVFVLGIKMSVMGGMFTLVAMTSIVARIITGKIFDKLHAENNFSDELLYSASACISSLTWILRLFVGSVGSILMIDMSGAIFGTIYAGFYVNYEQLGGKRMGNIAYFVYGEMMYSIMTIALFVAVLIASYVNMWREVFMIMASFWVLISIIMARESNMR